MKTLVLAVGVAMFAQSPPLHELMDLARPLTATEIAAVLSTSREALTGKTLRLTALHAGQRAEILMGSAGQPKIVRWTYGIEGGIVGGIVSGVVPGSSTGPTGTRSHEEFVEIIDYTGTPARRCDGRVEQGEMVIEYVLPGSTGVWTATARPRDARDPLPFPLKALWGTAPMTSGDRRQIGDRWARAFVSAWKPSPGNRTPLLTGDPMPNAPGTPAPGERVQVLWIDTESLVPLRWEVSDSRGIRTYAFDFTYESIDLRLPAGIDVPGCIR